MRSMVVAVAGTNAPTMVEKYTDRQKNRSTLPVSRYDRAPLFCLRPCDVQQPIRHRVVERQLAHHFTDFFVHMLIQPLGLVWRHAFLYFVEEAEAQIFGRRPHDPPDAVAARIAHDGRFFLEIEQTGLARE